MTRTLCCVVVLLSVASIALSQDIIPGAPVIGLGGNCATTLQCTIENAVCDRGACACNVTYYQVNETYCAKYLESPCITFTDCKGIPNAECLENRCSCPRTSVPNVNNTKCLPKARNYGDHCEASNQCDFNSPGSACSDGKCVCELEYFYNGSKCLYRKGLGEECNQPEFGCYLETTNDYKNVVCENGRCVCASGFAANVDNKKCLRRVQRYNDTCEEQVQCSVFGTGGSCKQQKCVCEIEYFFNGTKCLYKKGLGEECNSEFGCYLEADGNNQNVECVNGKCVCAKEFVASNDKTKCFTEMPAYNANCTDISRCTSLGTGGVCKFNKCVCEQEYFLKGTKCLYKKGLGEDCNSAEFGCYLKVGGTSNVNCVSGKCVCEQKYTANKDKTKCEKGAGSQLVVSAICVLAAVVSSVFL